MTSSTPPSLPSVLGVFAHPDDESLLAGGVLARHADRGARTAVVTATWAEDSPRAAELADALAVLGAGPPRMLGYGDARNPDAAPGSTRLVDAPLDDVVGRLVAEIRRFRPDIVIGHDALGQMTGHPDHRRTHQVTVLAVEAAALGALHPEAGEPWTVGALYAATHPDSGVGDLAPLLAGVGKSLLTVPDAYVTAAVDVTPEVGRKWRAVRAHRSQLERPRPLPALLDRLNEETRTRILGTEFYTRIGPAPGGGAVRLREL
ncbi:PIG-L deacetylase family protein [Streptomyces sp. NPDC000594]|uniref:PIG-L deacetylase family protein n=1 Tax=Streptomyces sp. NPDC000594 TaxID=3154261 RepID=UPI003327E730